MRAAIDLRARRVPRLEDGDHGPSQLLARILGERPADLALVDPLERVDEAAQVVRRQLDVLRDAALRLQPLQLRLEAVAVDAVDDLAVHLDQTPVRVEREALVAGRPGEALRRRIAEAEVQDRVHHPGHRDRSPRAHGDEQRVALVAEALARVLLERAHVLGDLVLEAVRELAPRAHVRATGVGRDREAARDRDSELRHLHEPDALAAEQLAPAVGRLVEVVDVLRLLHEE